MTTDEFSERRMHVPRVHPWRAAVSAVLLGTVAPTLVAQSGPAYAGAEWAAPGGDWAATRFSTLSQITTTNLARLGGAWVFDLPDEQVSKAPMMVEDGRLFVTTSRGTIFALDPGTGERRWTYEPETPYSGNRGVGIGEGLLFTGLRDSSVVAISQETGRPVWTFRPPPHIPSQGISTAPAYGNGVVVAGVSFGDNFLRGRALGVDAKTGRFLWSFEVVPAPGEPGHETWPPDSDVWKYGGGAIWTTPSVDAELGLVYLETGNAVPQWGGELRAGDNLFNDSVVALDLETGERRWHFQLIHHDIWEHDVSTPLVLYDATIGGRLRRVLVAMRTDGILFVLDRATGEPVLPVEERPVKQDASLKTSATQPFTIGVDRIGPECVEKATIPEGFEAGCYFDPIRADMPNTMLPHMNMRQSPMAYSPETGYLYATACVNPAWIRRDETGWAFVRPVRVPGGQPHGLMAAIDAATGSVVWERRLAYAACQNGAGATATAGGLVFHIEADGHFQAYHARTGDLLWQFQTGEVGLPAGAGPGGGPAVVYEHEGEQYVAVVMNRAVWAFKLGGALPPRAAPEAPDTTIGWNGPIADQATIALGSVTTFDIESADRQVTWTDPYGVSPARTRTKAGAVVTFTNTTNMPHTVTSRDGSWSVGLVAPGESRQTPFATPGTYEFVCADHPWSVGQLIVEP